MSRRINLPVPPETVCAACGLGRNPVPGEGNLATAKVLLIGEAPGREEVIQRYPFAGDSGKLLRAELEDAGIDAADIAIINTCACRPPNTPTLKQISCCKQRFMPMLRGGLMLSNLKIVVPCGAVALRAITNRIGISAMRGKVVEAGLYVPIFPIWHPAYILRNPGDLPLFRKDMAALASMVAGKKAALKMPVAYSFAQSVSDVKRACADLCDADAIAFDVETTSLTPWAPDAKVLSIAFAWDHGKAVGIPLDHPLARWSQADRASVIRLVSRCLGSAVPKVAHNVKFDATYLRVTMGIFIANIVDDTMLAKYLLDERRQTSRSLKELARDWTDMGGYADGIDAAKLSDTSLSDVLTYNCADADATLRLHRIFFPALIAEGLVDTLRDVMLPGALAIGMVEATGIGVDLAKSKAVAGALIRSRKWAEKALRGVVSAELGDQAMRLFNPKSSASVRAAWIGIGFQSTAKTKGGNVSVSKQSLTEEEDHPFAKNLTAYRDADKMLSTYLAPILSRGEPIVHGSFHLTSTVTGRLSSSQPNLQNIPRDSFIRELYIPLPGHEHILSADYSQIEVLMAGVLSGEERIRELFVSGRDLHREIAAKVFGKFYDAVTDQERTYAKRVTFGVLYGMEAQSLARQINVGTRDAERFISQFFGAFPTFRKWAVRVRRDIEQDGYVRSLYGRKRRFPQLKAGRVSDSERSECYRQGVNAPIQAAASDLTLRAVARVSDWLWRRKESRVVSIIHDQLLVSVAPEELPAVVFAVRRLMETPDHPRLDGWRLKVDIKIGKSWGELEEA